MKKAIVISALVLLTALSGGLFLDSLHSRSELKAERQKASTEITQARVNIERRAQHDRALLEKQLEETKQEVVRLNNEIRFPIEIACKKSNGTGYSVQVLNTSSEVLPVTLILSNTRLNKSRSFRLELNPGFSREVSNLEGWTSVAGDSLQVDCPGYLPVTRVLQ